MHRDISGGAGERAQWERVYCTSVSLSPQHPCKYPGAVACGEVGGEVAGGSSQRALASVSLASKSKVECDRS